MAIIVKMLAFFSFRLAKVNHIFKKKVLHLWAEDRYAKFSHYTDKEYKLRHVKHQDIALRK